MENVLEIRDVCKNYGEFTALDNISVSVPEGSVFGLLGPNGAGKTSLIRIINQITMPDSGTLHLGGEKLAPHHVHNIGYLPEERGLYKSMKVGEQALYLAQLKGMSAGEANKRLREWFEKFDITDWWHKKIQELSKGMAQKVQFIVTVLHQPKLLIFDEPFSGFDPVNANLIKDEILQLRDAGSSIIFSTHRMESVEEMCDHIALINQSKKVLDGKLSDVKNQFKDNHYEVGLHVNNPDTLLDEIRTHFQIEKVVDNAVVGDLNMVIALEKNNTSNQLIQFLNSRAQISHFTEIIPTANDIFLKAVSSNE